MESIKARERITERVTRHKLLYLSFAAVFVLGLALGIFLKRSSSVYLYYLEYSKNYYFLILERSSSTAGLFGSRLLNNLCFFLLVYALCFTVYCSPVHFLIFIYRGFLLGTMCAIIIVQFGFGGAVIVILVVVPQHVVTAACLMLACGCGTEYALLWHRQKCVCNVKEYSIDLAFYFVLSLAGAILEQLLLLLLIRPLNFFF